MLNTEQFIAASKANVEIAFGLAGKALEGVEKIAALNLASAKSALNDAAENTKAAMAATNPQELLSLQAGLLQPAAEKAVAYGREVYDIAAATNAEVSKVVEAQLADAQKNIAAFVDSAVKNAPAGSENAVALVKSAVAAASNAYESVQKAAKQAAEVAEANFNAVTTSAVKATANVAAKAKKTA